MLWCTAFTVAQFDGKYLTFYLMAIVMFALSLVIYEILTNQEIFQNFYLEIDGLGQGVEE